MAQFNQHPAAIKCEINFAMASIKFLKVAEQEMYISREGVEKVVSFLTLFVDRV